MQTPPQAVVNSPHLPATGTESTTVCCGMRQPGGLGVAPAWAWWRPPAGIPRPAPSATENPAFPRRVRLILNTIGAHASRGTVTNPETWSIRCVLKRQQPEQAIRLYEQAVAQDPSKLLYYVRLGVANFRSQHYAKAREVFNSGLARFPDNPNLYFLLGYTARADGHYDEAIAAFRQALRLQPDNSDVLGNLGYIASQRGENEEAERLLRRAIALNADGFPAYHDLGRLLVKLKKYKEALPILLRGAELNKKDPGVHYQLFLAYSRLGKKAEADEELALFKRLDEVSRHGTTPLGMTVKAGPANETEALPPLSSAVSGEAKSPDAPRD